MCDILFGYAGWKGLDDYGEGEIPIVVFTDCESLFNNLKKDVSVPDDKWVAVPAAFSEEQSAQVPDGILGRLKPDGLHHDGSWQTV